MLENTLKAVIDYSSAYKQAEAVRNEIIKRAEEKYKDNKSLYNKAIETAETIYHNYLDPIKTMSILSAKSEIDYLKETASDDKLLEDLENKIDDYFENYNGDGMEKMYLYIERVKRKL